jgi:hypothetical protein
MRCSSSSTKAHRHHYTCNQWLEETALFSGYKSQRTKGHRGRERKKKQGKTGEEHVTETERIIGQLTHEHQPRLRLHHPLSRRTDAQNAIGEEKQRDHRREIKEKTEVNNEQ